MLSPALDLRLSRKQYESVEPIALAISGRRESQTKTDFPRKLNISHNLLERLPGGFIRGSLLSVVELDISDNRLKSISVGLSQLPNLKLIDARGNLLSGVPEDIADCASLEEVNLGDNHLDQFPAEFLSMQHLKELYLGSNRIAKLPSEIKKMIGLEVLFLGGNRLASLPDEIAELPNLTSLTLCHNHLSSLPLVVCEMHRLESLQLHNNRLETLPPALLQMKGLHEISLRNNPLVSRFVREHVDEVPTLMELAARSIRNARLRYSPQYLPRMLVSYLDSSQHCDNPACRGVYFHTCYRKVKFVDFCGKYRVPFLHYLCSPECQESVPGHNSAFSSQSSSNGEETGDEDSRESRKMRRVLISNP